MDDDLSIHDLNELVLARWRKERDMSRRYSDFWRNGGELSAETRRKLDYGNKAPRKPPDAPKVQHHYGVEYGRAGPVVFRFDFAGDRDLWVLEDETRRREKLTSGHRLVRSAIKAGQWDVDDTV